MAHQISLYKKRMIVQSITAATLLIALSAQAVETIDFGNDKSLSLGFGMRTSFSSVENGATNGTSRSNDFNIDSARLFVGASLTKDIKGMFNTEKDANGNIQVMDLVGEFALTPDVNIWAGRMLSPSDRANMAGGYYSLGGGYAGVVASRYGANGGIVAGRDDGVTLWGNALDNKLGYSFGAFQGYTLGIGSLTQSQAKTAGVKSADNLMYAARLQYDFWDAEPGYYGTGTYLGAKDILAVGIAGRTQNDGVLTTSGIGNYSSGNIDFLLEKKIAGAGAVSLEGAYYNYNTSGVILSEQGKAYLAGAGYIFKDKLGMGQLQPFTRYQKFDADNNITTRQYDLGVNYIIDGYNAQVSVTYSKTDVTSQTSINKVVVALQLQF